MKSWVDIQDDLSLTVLNNGIGGSRTWELLAYADKLVTTFRPKTVIVYGGSNDIDYREQANQIAGRTEAFMQYLSTALPGVEIIYISINKSPQKQSRWDIIDKTNALVKKITDKNGSWHFVDINPGLFNEQGMPRADMFKSDNLHLEKKAYRDVWAPMIREKMRFISASRN